jgi:hypothetical protein
MSRPRTSSTRAALVLELLIEHDPALLDFDEAYALTGLDRELRQKVLDRSALWELMTQDFLPSLKFVPKLTPRGRNGFLRSLRLNDDTWRVRPTPIPDAFRRGAETPKSITFLVDVFTGEDEHVSSNVWTFKLDAEGNLFTLQGKTINKESALTSHYEVELVTPSKIHVVEALAFSSAEARRNEVDSNHLTCPVSARVIFSFVVDDEGPPIVLLNEFESLFNNEDHLAFSTDVSEAWLRRTDFSSSTGLSDALLRRGAKFQAGCDLRYGPRSFPFDPIVRVYFSPFGVDRRVDVDGRPLFTSDSVDRCSALIETAFDGGGDLTTSSAEEVLRALMRLREDQKRQALF